MYFQSVDEVSNALEHFLIRPSKATGRQITKHTAKTARYFFTQKVKEVLCSGLRDGELMREIDYALMGESKTHRSIGVAVIAQFTNYYELTTDEVYKWWVREGNLRYKPNKPVSERIISKENLKKYFDLFLQDDPSHFTQARLYLYSSLLLLSGARQRAIVSLCMDDFMLTETELVLSIRRLKSFNISKQIINIPLDVKLPNGRPFGEAVYKYLALKPSTSELFVDTLGVHGPGLFMSMMHQMERHGKKAGIGHVTPHMFRFTCASIVSDYVGIKQAQQLLGHSEMRTTMRYAGQFYDNVSRATISNGFAGLNESYNKGAR